MHELRVFASASVTREAIPAEPDSNAPGLTIKGPLIEQDIRLHTQRGLLMAFAGALDNAPKAPSEVKWLDVGGDL